MLSRPTRRAAAAVALAVMLLVARDAAAQTLGNVLSFLLTNRSIPTGDIGDEEAAAATSTAIASFLLTEIGTLPSGSSSSGFTYRLDPTLGATIRSSESFGALFTERALTAGAGQVSFGISYQPYRFETIDGRSLRDGTLISTASKLRDNVQLYDVETLTLRLTSDAVTVQANAGVTDRFDVGAAFPVIRVSMSGTRVDNYSGSVTTQASASGSAFGPGDALVRLKYNISSASGSGFAVAVDTRLPTGDEANLLGTGEMAMTPRAIVSLERARGAVHANLGYTFFGRSDEFDFSTAGTYAVTPRLTVSGEIAGRRLGSAGRLTEIVTPHPHLIDVDTVHLTTADEATTRLTAVAALKWNVRSSWLVGVNVLRPLTSAGLNTGWTPMIAIDRSFEF
jgi:hypothetical protein